MNTLTFLAVIAAVVVLCIVLGEKEKRRQASAKRKQFIQEFGKPSKKVLDPERQKSISAYFFRHPPKDAVDDTTWEDLDLSLVFQGMDKTKSAVGEEYLYALLRSPIPQEKRQNTDSSEWGPEKERIHLTQIRYFEEESHFEEWLMLEMALARLGYCGSHSIYEYLDRLDEIKEESNAKHLPAFLLPALSIVILFIHVPTGVLCLIGSLILNMVTYYRRRGEIEPYMVSFAYLLRMLSCADEVTKFSCEAITKEQKALGEAKPAFAKFRRFSGVLMSGSSVSSGSPLDIIVDYMRILFHIDLIKFNTMVSQVKEKQDEIDQELTILGKIDTILALSSYEKSLPYTCDPVLLDSKEKGQWIATAYFNAKDMYHPLLDNPVPNSIETRRCILVTGSNASGKSTFLKAVALCALFAQTIGFCPAKQYEGSIFRIRTSMAHRDSIVRHESYFMAEIRSLKRIADLSCDAGEAVLCCIDEVLRGTNTVERIAASSEILSALSQRNVLCFAATHDTELSYLLEDQFDNRHFEETLIKRDVTFSYRLKPGKSQTRNAIALLSEAGFDEEITKKAKKRAEEFEQTGQWKK